MAEKILNTRIALKHDTEANYESVADVFKPLAGEVCLVRTAYGLRVKVGDGSNVFGSLPYADEQNSIVQWGYFLNNNFYRDSTYQSSVLIPKCDRHVYIDKNSGKNDFYLCDGTNYSKVSPSLATAEIPGIMKLYQVSGQNTDGTMSQKAITDGVNAIKFAVDPVETECLILDLPWD